MMNELQSQVVQFPVGGSKRLNRSAAKSEHLNRKFRCAPPSSGKVTLNDPEAVSHQHCTFDKWYYRFVSRLGLRRYRNIADLLDVKVLHAKLHRTVKDIVRLANGGALSAFSTTSKREFKVG